MIFRTTAGQWSRAARKCGSLSAPLAACSACCWSHARLRPSLSAGLRLRLRRWRSDIRGRSVASYTSYDWLRLWLIDYRLTACSLQFSYCSLYCLYYLPHTSYNQLQPVNFQLATAHDLQLQVPAGWKAATTWSATLHGARGCVVSCGSWVMTLTLCLWRWLWLGSTWLWLTKTLTLTLTMTRLYVR